MNPHWVLPIRASTGDLDDMDYRGIVRKMLMSLKYDDAPVGENRGSNAPKQDALVHLMNDFLPSMPPIYDVINLTIIYKPMMDRRDFMHHASWGSYTIIYPHGRFPTQAHAIIASLSQYDRRRAGIRIFMDGALDYILDQFGNPAAGDHFHDDFIYEIKDSLCVVEAPKHDVTIDRNAHVHAADRVAWICSMLMLYKFISVMYSKEFQAMKQIVYDLEYIHAFGLEPMNCYKEKLPPGKFDVTQPPVRGRTEAEKADEEAKLDARLPDINATPFRVFYPPYLGPLAQ